jgi:hypothetical protein
MAEDTPRAMQDQLMEALRTNQAAVVDAVRNWTESVRAMMPDLPATPLTDALPELPDPAELVDRAFEFAEELLATQREFTRQLLKAASGTSDAAQSESKSQGSS